MARVGKDRNNSDLDDFGAGGAGDGESFRIRVGYIDPNTIRTDPFC